MRFIPRMQGWFELENPVLQLNIISILKKKNHMVISTETEKYFSKIKINYILMKYDFYDFIIL